MTKIQELRGQLNSLIEEENVAFRVEVKPNCLVAVLHLNPFRGDPNEIRATLKNNEHPHDAIFRKLLNETPSALRLTEKINDRNIDYPAANFLKTVKAINDIIRDSGVNYDFLLNPENSREIDVYQLSRTKMLGSEQGKEKFFKTTFKPSKNDIARADSIDAYTKVATVLVPKDMPIEQALEVAYSSTNSYHNHWSRNLNVTTHTYHSLPSTSVGDVMVVDKKAYAVAPMGFKSLWQFNAIDPKAQHRKRVNSDLNPTP